ncbi:MAG: hypothetical protein SNJ85_00965 [Cyanobacteriota bacterium]
MGITQIGSWGSLHYSFPLLAEAMGSDLGWPRDQVYGAVTLGLLLSALAAYPVGSLNDRGWGRGVMAGGSVLAGILLLGWSQVSSVSAFYALFAGIGSLQAATLLYPLLLERGLSTQQVVWVMACIGPTQVAVRITMWVLAPKASVKGIGTVMAGLFPLLPNGLLTTSGTMAWAVAPAGAAALWTLTGTYDAVVVALMAGSLALAGGFWLAVKLQGSPDPGEQGSLITLGQD